MAKNKNVHKANYLRPKGDDRPIPGAVEPYLRNIDWSIEDSSGFGLGIFTEHRPPQSYIIEGQVFDHVGLVPDTTYLPVHAYRAPSGRVVHIEADW